jgi:transcriptional regulator with XRE-family HTH domain
MGYPSLRTVTTTPPHIRFREARERLGLEIYDLASRSGFSCEEVFDIESLEGDLTRCYSPREVRKFCRVLRIRPVELFADSIAEPAVTAAELVRLIHAECESRGITLEEFEDAAGWRLSAWMEPPERLLEEMSIDGLRWLCQELRIDWRKVFLTL